MRVIFLDLDGVLNRTKSAKHIRFDKDLVAQFRTLIDRSDAHIVLSTFWRRFDSYISYVLSRYGIAAERFIGMTPGGGHLEGECCDDAVYADRSAEISAWLREHPEVTGFVVLDDRAEAGQDGLAPHFVHVKSEVGLSPEDVERALEILEVARQDL
mmetsp:Transcript_41390/g.66870  ORF Transcript_41390/g.66870 Transcript_41390/m.66870 type:complete len:156 (+) Transcript_41390:56-523(+)